MTRPITIALRDQVLACLRSCDTAMSVRMIKDQLGEGWKTLSYQQVANVLYHLEHKKIIPKRMIMSGGKTFWQAPAHDNSLEVLWDLPAHRAKDMP